jgi:hypothetical protein
MRAWLALTIPNYPRNKGPNLNVAAIVIPLLGVIIGAASTYFVTSRSEQLRHQHDLKKHELELRERWDQLELDAYVNYLGNAVEMSRLSGLASGARGFDDLAAKADLATTLVALDQAETRRAIAFERVMLLGEKSTADAGHQLNEALWNMEWIARALVDGSPEKWGEARNKYVKALIGFQQAARSRLYVSGGYIPRYEVARPNDDDSN